MRKEIKKSIILTLMTSLVLIVELLSWNNLFAAQLASPLQASDYKRNIVEGEVLIKFKPSLTIQGIQSTISVLGGASISSISKQSGISKVKLPPGQAVADAVSEYKLNPNIVHAQPNYIYYTTALPDDSRFSQLWALRNTGQLISDPSVLSPLNPIYTTNNPGSSGFDIDAQSAWEQITDCSSVIVAVLDTGINYTHQDLAANMWDGTESGYPNHGYDFIDLDNDPMPTGASEDHGTHVAGTIGAIGNNNVGISGICWQARIMSVRVLGENGSGSTAGIISGIEFASDNGAKVINMSLGFESTFDTLFSEAITYAKERDVVVVVAAGNGGSDGIGDDNDGTGDDGNTATIFNPCNFTQPNLICVTALDQAYARASFSNYGSNSVDVGAPGTNIISSYAGPVIRETFTSGWNLSGGWSGVTCDYGSGARQMLVNPSDWCPPLSEYSNNTDDRAYKSINLSRVTAGDLNYWAFFETETSNDYFSVAFDSNGGDPFDGTNDTSLHTDSGSTLPYARAFSHNLNGCFTSNCSVGFRLTSNASNVLSGVGILAFEIHTLKTNSDGYENLKGTSMASPHVAGIATMVRAFNPDYTYTQTVEAIKEGGEVVSSLSGISTTGKAANAMGTLAHITQPTGLAANVQ